MSNSENVMTSKPGRLVIYTVLVGDKESLGNPLSTLPADACTDLEIEFVCVTDNRLLESDVWRFEYLDSVYLPPEKLSRRAKAMPHEYFPDNEISLYVDNTVAFKRLPNSSDLALNGQAYLFRLFRHPTRSHPGEEAGAIAILGYESIPVLCEQLDFYSRQQPIESITPLSTCTVILRSHHHPAVVRQGVVWWEQILAFSKRDQMSFDFSLRETGCKVDYLPGFKDDNDLILWLVTSDTPRVAASFDPKRYAWIHREVVDAVRNPRAHFLKSGSVDQKSYSKQTDLLNYICYMHRSSLGDQIAPRRQITGPLGAVLFSKREQTGRMLLIWVNDASTVTGMLHEEFVSAAPSLATFLPGFQAQTLEISADALNQLTPGLPSEILFDLIVVFGNAPDQLANLAAMLTRFARPAGGGLVALTNAAGTIDAIRLARDRIAKQFKAVCEVSVTSSAHDSVGAPLANSLVFFDWKAKASEAKLGAYPSLQESPEASALRLNLGSVQLLNGYVNIGPVVEGGDGNGDIRTLDQFDDNCADEIISIHAIQHFWRWEIVDILREWVRVLKPGGKLVLECPNLFSSCEALLLNREGEESASDQNADRCAWRLYGDPGRENPHECYRWLYTPQSLAQIMHLIGLQDLEQTPPCFGAGHPADMRIEGTKSTSSSAG